MILRLHHVTEPVTAESMAQNNAAPENSVGSSDALLLDDSSFLME